MTTRLPSRAKKILTGPFNRHSGLVPESSQNMSARRAVHILLDTGFRRYGVERVAISGHLFRVAGSEQQTQPVGYAA